MLPETIFVIDLGAANYGAVEPVSSRRADNYKAYLGSLMRMYSTSIFSFGMNSSASSRSTLERP